MRALVLLRGWLVVVGVLRGRRRVEGHGEDVRTEQRGAAAVRDDVVRVDLTAGVGHAAGRVGLDIEGALPLDSRLTRMIRQTWIPSPLDAWLMCGPFEGPAP